MVIGLLVVSAIPTTIGVCEALSAQKKANAAAKEKAKFHLTATVCLDDSGPVECWCILKDGRVSFPRRVVSHMRSRCQFPPPHEQMTSVVRVEETSGRTLPQSHGEGPG